MKLIKFVYSIIIVIIFILLLIINLGVVCIYTVADVLIDFFKDLKMKKILKYGNS